MLRKLSLLFGIGVVGVILDQWSKEWAKSLINMPPRVVVEGFFDFIYVENKGAAWSSFANLPDGIRVPFFVILSCVAVAFILYFFSQIPNHQVRLQVALSSVLSGAVGNLIDRIIRGSVIDFVDWHIGDTHWPTFNVADVFISVGVGLLALEIFFGKSEISISAWREEAKKAKTKER